MGLFPVYLSCQGAVLWVPLKSRCFYEDPPRPRCGVQNTDFHPLRQERQLQAWLGGSAASPYRKQGPSIFPSGEEQTQPKLNQTLGSPLLVPLFQILLRTNIFYISFNFFLVLPSGMLVLKQSNQKILDDGFRECILIHLNVFK